MIELNKILTTTQIRAADAYTIQHEPISSLDLMERASQGFVKAIEDQIQYEDRIAIVCGIGNNGGDGLAVARLLIELGYSVSVYLFNSDKLSDDCLANKNRLTSDIQLINDESPDFHEFDVIIDAIFGSGLSRKTEGVFRDVIMSINRSNAFIVSIDIPSGMFCDTVLIDDGCIESDLAISFQRPKLSFFFPESEKYIKSWKVIPIGLDESYIQAQESKFYILDQKIKKSLKDRSKFSHKGTNGHALMIAGSFGKIGASILASKACLRSGAGLVTIDTPKCGYEIIQSALPEAMCVVDKAENEISSKIDLSPYSSIGIGPGIGQSDETTAFMNWFLKIVEKPVVIDADAINIIAKESTLLELIPENSILTPHPKEFQRLVGDWKDSEECLKKQLDFSLENNCIVILKRAHTCITTSRGEVFFNTSGNPAMATAGSGDVLTGIITGLLAQNYSPLESAFIGVYFHGKSGDAARNLKGEPGVIASDLIENLRIE